MAAGYRSGGVDFDDLFDPDVMGDGPSAAGLRSGGVPLKYAARAYGSKRADVGYRQGGVDVSNLWAAKGTAQYVIPGLGGKALSADGEAPTSGSTASASVSVTLGTSGQWAVSGNTQAGAVAQPPPTSGTWTRPGTSAADFDIRFRVTHNGGGTMTNTAPVWVRGDTAVQGVTLAASVPGASPETVSGSVTIHIDVRSRASGAVSTTTLTGSVSATGFQ